MIIKKRTKAVKELTSVFDDMKPQNCTFMHEFLSIKVDRSLIGTWVNGLKDQLRLQLLQRALNDLVSSLDTISVSDFNCVHVRCSLLF